MRAAKVDSSGPRPVRVDFKTFLEQLRDRITLSEIVGRKVVLKRKGREHAGLCPFHNEKTPSFWVNDAKAFFHCFGCGAHGDAIGFVMRTAGLDFMEAVGSLAQDLGLTVPTRSPKDVERAQRVASLHQVIAAADRFFQRQLAAPGGKAALDYLQGRGLAAETIGGFGLGFAPDNREALRMGMKREGITETQLIDAGLVAVPDDAERGAYERFRGRVMFPIHDRRGRVIAFGGRVLDEGTPKYLNSPETPLFAKGETLYALHLAREAAAAGRPVIVVEGYLDVIALHQAGFNGAVAPLGTALTEAQLAALWRLADEPYLCFDGDAAGQRAASRAAERALPMLAPGKSLRFVTLPAGEDPDSLVRKGGAAAIEAALAAAAPLVDLIWQVAVTEHKDDTPERQAGIGERVRALVDSIGDASVRARYHAEFGRRLRDRWPGFKFTVIAGGRSPAGAADGAPDDAKGRGRRSAGGEGGDGVAARFIAQHEVRFDLFRDQYGTPYATADLEGVRQHVPVESQLFAHVLRLIAQENGEGMLGAGAVEAIRDNLAARAALRGAVHETAVRIGMAGGRLYVHLRPGRFVEIAAGGPVNDVPAWRLVDESPVKFVWPRLALPLLDPVPGGDIDSLRPFVNLDGDNFQLFACWMLQAMQVDRPYCHLSISGAQGSAKTGMLRVAKRLLDPSVADTRALARDERDLLIAALNAHVLTADNVSTVNAERSDMLCRLSTGGGLSTRRLHSNDEESVVAARRPMVFTSIGDIMRRGDLADRCIVVQAAQLPAGKRQAEADLWEAFDREEAALRGALYDALGVALAGHRETPAPAIRMADAGRWMVAGAVAFGWEPSTINRLLGENRNLANLTVIESDTFALELIEFLSIRPEWRGAHAELLDALNAQAPDRVKRGHSWPNNPNGVRSQLQRLKAALEGEGVAFDVGKTNGRRWLQFSRIESASGDGEASP